MAHSFQDLHVRRSVKLSFKSLIDSLEIILSKQWEDLTESTIERTKWIILDTAVAAWEGTRNEELAAYLADAASEEKNMFHPIPIIGTGFYASGADSLMLHGTAVVSNELDEGNQFAKGHPAAHIFPAAYLAAIENNSSGQEFIRAFVLAYEISARFAYACNMNDDMHPHGTWGTIGGAVAAGILKRKSTEELINIVLLAASLPLATSWEAAVTGQTARNLYTGISSQIAYHVPSLQQYGFESSVHVVEHIWGTLISNKVNATLFTKELWAPPLVEKSFFKYYPTCRFTHSSIDALFKLTKINKIDVSTIKSIKVETYQLAARLVNDKPDNKLSAKFAIPFLLANILLENNLYSSFGEAALKDKLVVALASKITVEENEEMTKALPEERAARITITLKDGTILQDEVKDASGGYKEPLSIPILTDKYENMLGNKELVAKLITETNRLDEVEDVTKWVSHFHGKGDSVYETVSY